jgi:hypothetical protein
MLMLLTSAPVLIEAPRSRAFLEVAQGTAGELLQALRANTDDDSVDIAARVDAALDQLREAAAPVVVKLDRAERAAVKPTEAG